MDFDQILQAFGISGTCTAHTPLQGGSIHSTWLLETDSGRYVLQEMHSFADPAAVTEQAVRVTEHLRRRDPRTRTLHFYPTQEGWLHEGRFRLMDALPGVPLSPRSSPAGIEAAGYAFGRFAAMLSDLRLPDTSLRSLHDTRQHLERLRGRKLPAPLTPVLRKALTLGEAACMLREEQREGLLPTRIVHGDTKAANVLLAPDGSTAVIDLDTVAPGLTAYDYGDGIRSAAASGGVLDLPRFRAFTRGYLRGMPLLTDAEMRALVPGIFCVTTELAMRYLNDLAEGCGYFHKTPDQTAQRAEALLGLALSVHEQQTALRDEVEQIRHAG